MRNRRLFNTNTGSIHATMAIGLVVILIAALGWVFYTNFVAKETAKLDTSQSKTDPQQQNTVNNEESLKVATVKDGILRLDKWGIEAPVNNPLLSDIKAQYVEYTSEHEADTKVTGSYYDIQVPLESISPCQWSGSENSTNFVNLGNLSRYNPDENTALGITTYRELGEDPDMPSWVNVEQYTYGFQRRQDVPCQQDEANKKADQKIEKLYEAFQKIRAIQ